MTKGYTSSILYAGDGERGRNQVGTTRPFYLQHAAGVCSSRFSLLRSPSLGPYLPPSRTQSGGECFNELKAGSDAPYPIHISIAHTKVWRRHGYGPHQRLQGCGSLGGPHPLALSAHSRAAVLWDPEGMPERRVPLPDWVAAATFMQYSAGFKYSARLSATLDAVRHASVATISEPQL